MKIWNSIDDVHDIINPVVTTGAFDGVHLGHQKILEQLNKSARDIGGESVLITFFPHPKKILYPDTLGKNLQLINSKQEKIDLLRKSGLDHLIIHPFTKEFSQTSSADFVCKYLVNKIKCKKIIIGFNHFFGFNKEGDYKLLNQLGNEYGFDVEEIPHQDIEHEAVSSTKIREALQEGNVQKANALLSHYFFILGYYLRERSLLDAAGFTGYSIKPEELEKLIPPTGTYEVSTLINGRYYRGMALIHEQSGKSTISIHLFDLYRDISGYNGKLYFHKLIHRFANNATINNEQIKNNVALAENLIY